MHDLSFRDVLPIGDGDGDGDGSLPNETFARCFSYDHTVFQECAPASISPCSLRPLLPLQRKSRMLDDRGLLSLEPCFRHAVFFLVVGCASAGITEMDFNSADMFVEMGQFLLNQTLDNGCEASLPSMLLSVLTSMCIFHALRKFPGKCKG